MFDLELNPKFTALLIILIFCCCLAFPYLIWGLITTPFIPYIKHGENVTYVKDIVESNPSIIDGMKAHPEVVEALINNNTKNLVKEVPITIIVTPTPDGRMFFANEYQNGTRLLGRPFSFIRYNVTGFQDMKITARVYDYQIYNYLHWFNPTDYHYYSQYPSGKDNKFLFVFFNIEMDNTIGDDTRMWLVSRNMFRVQINSALYAPVDYPLQLRIMELENHVNYQDSLLSQAYKQTRSYTRNSAASDTAGEISIEDTWLRAGKSNSADGYILFEIPKDTKDTDILVLTNFYAFGQANWRLKNAPDYPYQVNPS